MPIGRHTHVSEYQYWSPIFGAEAVRLSMTDDQGQEYFCLLRHEDAGWSRRRKEAADKLREAIELELPAGEIRWR